MSLNTDRSTLIRLNKEVGDLRSKEAAEIKREADATKKMNTASDQARKANSASLASSYLSTANREIQNIQRSQENRSRHANDIARKSQEIAKIQERIIKSEELETKTFRSENERARKLLSDANIKLRRDYESRVANLEAQIAAQIEKQASSTTTFEVSAAEGETEPYDFFISHAWSDKADFVDGFVRKAEDAGLRVWYDKFALTWGDSIRQKIDEGLRSAYFGVVILSPNFFERPWPNYELDGIIQRDLSGKGRLLPIWHRLTQDDVEKHAPSLAGRLALSTASSSSDAIVKELIVVRDRFKEALKVDREPSAPDAATP